MTLFPTMKNIHGYLDSIMLSPAVTLSLFAYNKKSGASSGQKSITLSTCTSLFRVLLALLALMLFFRAMYLFFCFKIKRKWMKKMRKRGKAFMKK